jgi:hypothetical protein
MHENIRTVFLFDKAESLGIIEPRSLSPDSAGIATEPSCLPPGQPHAMGSMT